MDVESVSGLLSSAEKFTFDNDRIKFKPYFEVAEKYCAENNIIIGGSVGIDLLLGRSMTKDSWSWDLYCPNAFENAKELITAMYATKINHVDSRTLTLQTNIKHREFTILADARFLFKIYSLEMYRGVVLAEVMNPTICTGWFGSQVKVFPPEIVLIGIYQNLYSPAKFRLWEGLLANEELLFRKYRDALYSAGKSDVVGNFDKSVADDILLRSLLKDSRIALIGDYAMSKLGISGGSRIQILTDIPLSELAQMTTRVLSHEKNQLRRMKVSHVRCSYAYFNLNVPSDFQITKHTVYAVLDNDQIPLYDVFNSPEYEMIPFKVVDKIQVAAPYVLLRFIFIDIWILRLIIGISGSNLQTRINGLIRLAVSLRDYISAQMSADPFSVFPRDNYIGVNMSETVAKKKLIANIGYRLPNYYPALN